MRSGRSGGSGGEHATQGMNKFRIGSSIRRGVNGGEKREKLLVLLGASKGQEERL